MRLCEIAKKNWKQNFCKATQPKHRDLGIYISSQKMAIKNDECSAIHFIKKQPPNLAQRRRLFAANQQCGTMRRKRHLRINKSRLSHVYQTIASHIQAVMLTELSRLCSILKCQQPHQLCQWILHSKDSIHQLLQCQLRSELPHIHIIIT